MNHKLIIILILTHLSFWGRTQLFDPFFEEKTALEESRRFIKNAETGESVNSSHYNLTYQRMEWNIDPNVRYIEGNITSYFVSQCDGFDAIEFDLHANLTVDSVIHQTRQSVFFRKGNKVIIRIDQPLTNQQTDSVTVHYRGEPPSSGFGSFTQGWHQGEPIIWTLSEPYGAMEWWPCKQTLFDKIDSIEIIVTTPEKYRTAANGILVSEMVSEGKRTMHWKHRYPIATYLLAVAVTNYAEYSDYLELGNGDEIEILNYVYPENLTSAKENTAVTTEIMALFNNLIGIYPFAREKYGHAQFSWGGGMEHQTMSFMGSFGFHLIAHELAHQWFGNYITLGSWKEIWLNEGFATYMNGLAYEHLLDGIFWMPWKKQQVEKITTKPGGSVFVDDTTSVTRIFDSRLSYSKGAYLLHMLRWVLGDENFFNGIRSYFNDPELANGFASTQHLVKHMETAGDTTLTEFFNDWYLGEGFPVFHAAFKNHGDGFLKITLSQAPSHSSVDFFEIPVPVRVYSAQSDSADFRLVHTAQNQDFFVEPGFEVAKIVIDPDYRLVSKTSQVVATRDFGQKNFCTIFPNPFTGKITVSVPRSQNISSVKLFSMSGKCLLESGEQKNEIDGTHLLPGIYMIQVTTGEELFVQKIVKQ